MMAVEEGCKPGPVSARGAKLCGSGSGSDLAGKELDCLGSGRIRRGKLNLVDLAGSERQSKTGKSPGPGPASPRQSTPRASATHRA